MLSNIKKNKINRNFLIKIFFNIFPIIMLMPSGYITLYLATFIIYSYIFLFNKKFKIKVFFIDYLIFIFFTSSIISTIIGYKNFDYIIIAKSFADFRFALLFLLIRNLFYYKIIEINSLLRLSFLCVIFLTLDIFLQFFSGKDIFGYPMTNDRYSGVFGDEAIAGSYLQKLSIFAILAIFYLKFKKILHKELFIIFFIIILGVGILLTLDRIPFFIFIASLFVLLISIKSLRKIFFFSILAIVIFFFLFYKNNDLIKKRYDPVYRLANIALFALISDKIQKFDNKNKETFKEKTMNTGIEYYLLFDSAIYTFKYNFWIGSGRKSYYKSCEALRKYRGDLLCAPHTHNIYLEVLNSQGVIGMFIFLSFIIILLKKYFSDLIIHRTDKSYKILKIFLLVLLIFEIFPLRSHGYIFQTVNGTMLWFLISIISSKLLIKKI